MPRLQHQQIIQLHQVIIASFVGAAGQSELRILMAAESIRFEEYQTANALFSETVLHILQIVNERDGGLDQLLTRLAGSNYGTVAMTANQLLQAALAPDRPASVSQAEDNRKGGSEIFISYSRRDAKWLTDVQTYLHPLRIYSKIEIWDDTRITPGSQWRTEIKNAIERAEVFIILISAHFVASEFIAKNELPPLLKAAKQQGKLVIPLILNHSFLDAVPELAEFQSLNAPSKPLEGMSKVGRGKVLKELVEMVYAHFSRRQQTGQILAGFH